MSPEEVFHMRIPFKILYISSMQGPERFLTSTSPTLCLTSCHPSMVSLGWSPGPCSGHPPPAGIRRICQSFSSFLHNPVGRVTQGWLRSHSYARSSAVLCMRWQDSQAQAVSPIKCLSRSSTFKCQSCHLNELKAAKIKTKREREREKLIVESERSRLD